MKAKTKPLKIISRKEWLLFVAILALCAALGVWMVNGTLLTTAASRGVLTVQGDAVEIHSLYPGAVSEFCVDDGAYVEAGQTVVRILQADTEISASPADGTAGVNTVGFREVLEQAVPITADQSGYIIFADVSKWSAVDLTDPIARLCPAERKDNNNGLNYVWARVEPDYLNRLVPGETKAMVYPYRVNTSVYGYISGTVISIESSPRSASGLLEKTGSAVSADFLLGEDRECYMALIRLQLTEDGSRPQYSIRQYDKTLPVNAECTVQFVLQETHPYEEIFRLEE